MNICVVGVGYVGLVTGTCFSEFGLRVTCVDNDESKINMLKQGEVPIYEPGLAELVQKNTKEGRLTFTTNIEEAVRHALVVFIAVGTPPDENPPARGWECPGNVGRLSRYPRNDRNAHD